jgi:hypothetical protein
LKLALCNLSVFFSLEKGSPYVLCFQHVFSETSKEASNAALPPRCFWPRRSGIEGELNGVEEPFAMHGQIMRRGIEIMCKRRMTDCR